MPDPTGQFAAQAASTLTKEGASLLARILGPAADEIGEHFRLKVHGYLSRNRNTVILEAGAIIQRSGAEAHELPLRTALPILEGSSREDDAALQQRWAALLANAAIAESGDAVPPVFADILSNLTPNAARVLDLLGTATYPRRGERYGSSPQAELQEDGGLSPDQLTLAYLGQDDFENIDEFETEKRAVMALVDLLVREGVSSVVTLLQHDGESNPLIHRVPRSPISQAGLDVRITHLGQQFLQACTPPKSGKPI